MKPGAPFAFDLTAGARGSDAFASAGAPVDGEASLLMGKAGEAFGEALAAASALPEVADGLGLAGTGQPAASPFESKRAGAQPRIAGPKSPVTTTGMSPATLAAPETATPATVGTATEIMATETTPAEIAPAEIAPAEIAPTELVPTKLVATEIAPTELAATELVPTELVPTKLPPTKLSLMELAPTKLAATDASTFAAPARAAFPTTAPAETATAPMTTAPTPIVATTAALSEGPAEVIPARVVVMGGEELISLLTEERGSGDRLETVQTGYPSARARQVMAGLRANDGPGMAAPARITVALATAPVPFSEGSLPATKAADTTEATPGSVVASPVATTQTARPDREVSADNQPPPATTLTWPRPLGTAPVRKTAAAFDAPVVPAMSRPLDEEPLSSSAAPLGATIARATPVVATIDPSAVVTVSLPVRSPAQVLDWAAASATHDDQATATFVPSRSMKAPGLAVAGRPASPVVTGEVAVIAEAPSHSDDDLVPADAVKAFVGLPAAAAAATVAAILSGAAPRAARADANPAQAPVAADGSSTQSAPAPAPAVRLLPRTAASVRAFPAQAAQASPLDPTGSVLAPGAPALPSIEQIGTLASADKGAFEDRDATLSERRPSPRTPTAARAQTSSAVAPAPGKVDPTTDKLPTTDEARPVADGPAFETDAATLAPAPGVAQTNAASSLAGAPGAAALSAGPAATAFVAPAGARLSGRVGIPGADLPTQLAGRTEATVAHATLAAAAAHGFVALAAHATLNARTLHARHGLHGFSPGAGQPGARGAHGGQPPLAGGASDPTAVRPLDGKGPLPAEAATLLPLPEAVAPRPNTPDSNGAALGAHLATQGQGSSGSTLSALFDLPPVPVAASAFLAQAAEDPSLRGSVMSDSASVSLDAGAAGEITLHLRVKDGVADVRVDGSAAPTLDLRPQELRVALASEGLTLGGFETGQRAPDQQAEFDRQDAGRTTSGESARGSTTTASSTTRSHQPAVTLGGRLHVTA